MQKLKDQAVVKTFAGNGQNATRNGPVGHSSLGHPQLLCILPEIGSVIISDMLQTGLRIADQTQLDTLAYSNNEFICPGGLSIPPNTENLVYLTDVTHSRIKRLNLKNMELSTLSGGIKGYNDGPLQKAKFNKPTDVETACNGRLLVICDTGNRAIRTLDFETGQVSTLCGIPGRPGKMSQNLVMDLKKVRFARPIKIEVSKFRQGIIYVLDEDNSCVVELDTMAETGKVICGIAGTSGRIEIDGAELLFEPQGMCELNNGFLLIADTGNECLRLLDVVNNYKCILLNDHVKPKNYELKVGEKIIKPSNKYKRGWVDGNLFESMFYEPTDCKYNGNEVFVVDSGNNVIRIIDFGQEVVQQFENEKLLKSKAFIEENTVPKVYCRKCQLECKVWNGKCCDRCGSTDIFALKSTDYAVTDSKEFNNEIKNDIIHEVFFKTNSQSDKEQSEQQTIVSPERLEKLENSSASSTTIIRNTHIRPDLLENSELSQSELNPVEEKLLSKVGIEPYEYEEPIHMKPEEEQYPFRQNEVHSTDKIINRLIDKINGNEATIQELEVTKRYILENHGNFPDEEQIQKPSNIIIENPSVFVSKEPFIAPLSYEIDLAKMQQPVSDFENDEDEYFQILLNCPIKDDFQAVNSLIFHPEPENLREFIDNLKLVSPFTLAVFSYEGDESFPVPLLVNKVDNYTEFIDTEATTVCLNLISSFEVRDCWIAMKNQENRELFVRKEMLNINPFAAFDCQDEVSYYCECNLAGLLKMSQVNQINEYSCHICMELENNEVINFDIVFGCGSVKGLQANDANLELVDALNQLEIVKKSD